jgi:hypothetical protein
MRGVDVDWSGSWAGGGCGGPLEDGASQPPGKWRHGRRSHLAPAAGSRVSKRGPGPENPHGVLRVLALVGFPVSNACPYPPEPFTQPCAAFSRIGSPPSFDAGTRGEHDRVLVAASTVAIVAIAAAVIVVALVVWYIVPRGGRRQRPPRS